LFLLEQGDEHHACYNSHTAQHSPHCDLLLPPQQQPSQHQADQRIAEHNGAHHADRAHVHGLHDGHPAHAPHQPRRHIVEEAPAGSSQVPSLPRGQQVPREEEEPREGAALGPQDAVRLHVEPQLTEDVGGGVEHGAQHRSHEDSAAHPSEALGAADEVDPRHHQGGARHHGDQQRLPQERNSKDCGN